MFRGFRARLTGWVLSASIRVVVPGLGFGVAVAPGAADAAEPDFAHRADLTDLAAPPQPLLGPDGLLWLGPLPPSEEDPRGVVLVDPRTGGLWVAATDLTLAGEPLELVLSRVGDGQQWWWGGMAWVEEDEQGMTLRRVGQRDLRFDANEPLPSGQRWPEGTTLKHAEGHTLVRTGGGYLLTFLEGRWWEFDQEGRLVFRGLAGGMETHVRWWEDRLVRLSTSDGRNIDLEVSPSGPRGEQRREARATGGMRARYRWKDDRWIFAEDAGGTQHRYSYDGEGRLERILWSDGSRVTIGWTGQDRVASLQGPGARRWRFTWGEAGIEAMERDGRRWTVTRGDGRTTVRDPLGRTASVSRDEQGRILQWTDPAGRTTRLERGPDGGLSVLTGPAGQRWRFDLDNQGRIRALTDAASRRWRYERDPLGWVRRLVGPDGRALRLDRDAQGRVRAVSRGSARIRFQRDARGLVQEVVHGNLSTTGIERDAAGRVVGVVDPVGNRYGVAGYRGTEPSEVRGPVGEVWRLRRDRLGRISGVYTEQDDEPVTWERDLSGRVSQIRRGSRALRITRRWDGHITRLTDALGRVTAWAWDAVGHLRSWQQPDGTRLQLQRDARGDLSALRWGQRRADLERDAAGRLQAVQVDGRDEPVLSVERDPGGRISAVGWPGGALRLRHDSVGRIRQVRLGSRRFVLDYDTGGWLASVRDVFGTWELRRDPDGLLTGLSGPRGSWRLFRDTRGLPERFESDAGTLTWHYDASGRLLKVRSAAGGALGIQRNEAGTPELVRLSDGVIVKARTEGDRSHRTVLGAGGRPVFEVAIRRDTAGRVVSRRLGAQEHRLRYDPLDHLVAREEHDGAWSLLSGSVEGPEGELVTLDARGRPTAAVGLPEGPPAWGIARVRLAYDQDASGSITGIYGDVGSVSLGYDALGRLTALDVYIHDAAEEGPGGSEPAAAEGEAAGGPAASPPGAGEGPVEPSPSLPDRSVGDTGQPFPGAGAGGEGGLGDGISESDQDAFFDEDPLAGEEALFSPDVQPEEQILQVPADERSRGARPDERWRIAYGPLGTLVSLLGPEGRTSVFTALGRILAWVAPEGSHRVLSGPLDTWVWERPDGRFGLVGDDRHGPVWMADSEGEYRSFTWTPLGGGRGEAAPLGPGGWFQLFAAGPLLGPWSSRDPVSGQLLGSSPVTWPWSRRHWSLPILGEEPWPQAGSAGTAPSWDPTWWSPRGPWDEPLALACALGAVSSPFEESWWSPKPASAPLPWLPAGLVDHSPPLGPGFGSWPMAPDPVVAQVLRAASRPTRPLSQRVFVEALLARALPSLPRPIPGLSWPVGLLEPVPSATRTGS